MNNRSIKEKGFTAHNPKVMPSFFPTINSALSRPLTSREELEDFILRNVELQGLTDAYRKAIAVSKELSGKIKPTTPAICCAALLDGKGRTLENVVAEVQCLALDFDHVPPELLPRLNHLIELTAYALIRFDTISGEGIRIVVPYERPAGCRLSYVELYQKMWQKAKLFYETLLGVKADSQCSDFLRLCGLAHDPNAYFNWQAEPLRLSDDELKEIKGKSPRTPNGSSSSAKSASGDGRQGKSSSSRGKGGQQVPSLSTEAPSMAEAEAHILNLLKGWGLAFEPGRHNEYVSHFGRLCLRYNIDKKEAFDYAALHFGDEYKDTISVMKSCYKKKELKGSWHFFREDESYRGQTSVKLLKQWLSTRYNVQLNLVTGRHEIQNRLTDDMKYLKWTNVDDTIINSLWMEMSEEHIRVTPQKLISIINSDFSLQCDPIDEYLRSRKPWDGKRDYIGEVADMIHVAFKKEYYHDQKLFKEYFRKWFVAMVVGWVTPTVVNQMMLILVGKGGIYKSTIFPYLLPPELRQYFLNESVAVYTDKDFMEAFASKILICLDEYDTTVGKNLNAFKSNVTKLQFSIRRPYDKFRTDLIHRASLGGTTNNRQFITDTENRRYLPWLVESIDNPYKSHIDYEGLYSQAVSLGKEVTARQKRGEDGWVYWLTAEEIEMMRIHNSLFMVPNYAEEQIKRYYRVPKGDTPHELIKFRYTAEIVERICTNPALRQNFELHNIGCIMSKLGFPKSHRRKGNGWLVIEREGIEIVNNSKFDCQEDEVKSEE